MNQNPRIWIDLDNAPHVHFFAPLLGELSSCGYEPLISVRSFGQTEELAHAYGLHFSTIGSHAALRSNSGRILETLRRAAQLFEFGIAHRPLAAVSHGSRALTLAAAALGIPSIALYDYEHVSTDVFHRLCTRVLVPDILLRHSATHSRNLHGYPGFKEEVYVYHFQLKSAILQQLELDPKRLIVTVRPPATWAHYHSYHTTTLFSALIEHLRTYEGAQVVVLARTCEQAAQLVRDFALDRPPFRITFAAVDGLSLLGCSDAVFSGGGTMSREAALLGMASYSIFAGAPGAVDRELERLGKLTMLRTVDEIAQLRLCKRPRALPTCPQSGTRQFILDQILTILPPKDKTREPSGQSRSTRAHPFC